MYSVVHQAMGDTEITLVARKWFHDETGRAYLERYGLPDTMQTLGMGIQSNYYMLSAIAALLSYLSRLPQHRHSAHSS